MEAGEQGRAFAFRKGCNFCFNVFFFFVHVLFKSYLELVCIAEDMDNDEVEVDLPVLRVFYMKDKALNGH